MREGASVGMFQWVFLESAGNFMEAIKKFTIKYCKQK